MDKINHNICRLHANRRRWNQELKEGMGRNAMGKLLYLSVFSSISKIPLKVPLYDKIF